MESASKRGGIGSIHDAAKVEWRLLELRKRAAQLEQEASTIDDQKDALREFIVHMDRNVSEIENVRGNVSRVETVNECVAEFNALVAGWKEKPLKDPAEAQRSLKALSALGRKIADARRMQSRGSEALQILEKLDEARSKIEKQIQRSLGR